MENVYDCMNIDERNNTFPWQLQYRFRIKENAGRNIFTESLQGSQAILEAHRYSIYIYCNILYCLSWLRKSTLRFGFAKFFSLGFEKVLRTMHRLSVKLDEV